MHFNARWDVLFAKDDKIGKAFIRDLKLCIWSYKTEAAMKKHLNKCEPWEKVIPPKEVILANLDACIAKWRKKSPWHVNHKDFERVYKNQRHHIEEGCLPDPQNIEMEIVSPCGKFRRVIRGTSQLEAYHAALKRIICGGKLSVRTCHQLLHMFTYEWNVTQLTKFCGRTMPMFLDPMMLHGLRNKFSILFGRARDNPFQDMPIPDSPNKGKPLPFFTQYKHTDNLPKAMKLDEINDQAVRTVRGTHESKWNDWFPKPSSAAKLGHPRVNFLDDNRNITWEQIQNQVGDWGLEINTDDAVWKPVQREKDEDRVSPDEDDDETSETVPPPPTAKTGRGSRKTARSNDRTDLRPSAPTPLLQFFSLLEPTFTASKIQEFEVWISNQVVGFFTDWKRTQIRQILQEGGEVDAILVLRLLRYWSIFTGRAVMIFTAAESKPHVFYPPAICHEGIRPPHCIYWDQLRKHTPVALAFRLKEHTTTPQVVVPPGTTLAEVKRVADKLHAAKSRRTGAPTLSMSTFEMKAFFPDSEESAEPIVIMEPGADVEVRDAPQEAAAAEEEEEEEEDEEAQDASEEEEEGSDEEDSDTTSSGEEEPATLRRVEDPRRPSDDDDALPLIADSPEKKSTRKTRTKRAACKDGRARAAEAVGPSEKTITAKADELIEEIVMKHPRGVSDWDNVRARLEYNDRAAALNEEHKDDKNWVPFKIWESGTNFTKQLSRIRGRSVKLQNAEKNRREAYGEAQKKKEEAKKEREAAHAKRLAVKAQAAKDAGEATPQQQAVQQQPQEAPPVDPPQQQAADGDAEPKPKRQRQERKGSQPPSLRRPCVEKKRRGAK